MDVGELVKQYLQVRDKKKEVEDRHKQELAPYNKVLQEMEQIFQRRMENQGLESLKAADGVAYKSVQTSVKAVDKTKFFDWVKENDATHLLDIRPAKVAVSEFTEETGTPPPGLDITRHLKINVRKT